MKKYLIKAIPIILAIILIIVTFLFITGKLKEIKLKHLNKATRQLLAGTDYNKRIEKLYKERENQRVIIRKIIERIEDKKLAKELQKEIDELIKKDDAIIAEKDKRLEEFEKQVIKLNKTINKRDKITFVGIVGIGTDSEFNLNGRFGGTINGKVYDGVLTKVHLGGGGAYTMRTDFNEVIHGADFIFDFIVTFGIGS